MRRAGIWPPGAPCLARFRRRESSRLAPALGATVVPDARRPAQACREKTSMRRGHPPRRHRRAMVSPRRPRRPTRAPPDEGLSYVVHNSRPGSPSKTPSTSSETEMHRGAACGARTNAGRSTASSSIIWARSPIADAPEPASRPPRSAGRGNRKAASPHAFLPSSTGPATIFPTPFFGMEPGTTKADIHPLAPVRWSQGDNGILDSSRKAYRRKLRAYRLGWPRRASCTPCGRTLVTYEPQWGSDVVGMYQSMVEGQARVPWELLVKDVPDAHHHDVNYLVDQLGWEKNVDPAFVRTNN